ncbi:MAG: cytochrome-c oxidase, cbb3-type subunit III [Gammaproteobacteria bacterium]|nr:cytochrome-c oxidase, cbb3-type subunit III [Gammaproteobacteria bacterium]
MTSGWSWFIIIVSLLNIGACYWLLKANGEAVIPRSEGVDTGHVWDGDLKELNSPLPRWWYWLFVITVVWGLGYLVFYPGLGNFAGLLGWSQQGQYAEEVQAAREMQAPRYTRFAAMSLPELSQDPDAMGEARSLFANGCAGCHGSDARGAPGFPNLTDNDWLYGNAPESVLATISSGRAGVMPGWQAVLGDDGVTEVVAYLQSLSSTGADPARAQAGAARFAMFCVACHGVDARGNQALGAPNLTDDIWLFGGDAESLRVSIGVGRYNEMPAHEALLGPDRVRLMAAYVLALNADIPGPSASRNSNDGSAGNE